MTNLYPKHQALFRKPSRFLGISGIALILACALSNSMSAQPNYLIGPAGSQTFGNSVTLLTNGNFVVTDPYWDDSSKLDVGAVYLYNGATQALISILRGATANDRVGFDGIVPLSNGNFLVLSSRWNNTASSAPDAGAITWVNGKTGLWGTVSSVNSLVGSSSGDLVGSDAGGLGSSKPVTELANGNFVINSMNWKSTTLFKKGAVTWGSGTGGTYGLISGVNSLIGLENLSNPYTITITPLSNGGYVVLNQNSSVASVTWGSGTSGIHGTPTVSNSLMDIPVANNFPVKVYALSNGNYVVGSPAWGSPVGRHYGAATWADGSKAMVGHVDISNSLIGAITGSVVGSEITVLTNGNYVVGSPYWRNAARDFTGAATWADGTKGITGYVSASNSLIGNSDLDLVGHSVALSNGNYVVVSPSWNNGLTTDAGAVTFGNGNTGIIGVVSSANSLIGSQANDQIGSGGVSPLGNGNYVVASPYWNLGGLRSVGAVTWGDGTYGTIGFVSSVNSLVGATTGDLVGADGIVPLIGSNYIIRSSNWDNDSLVDAGAITWATGTTRSTGFVSSLNSIVGRNAGENLGAGNVLPLRNGNFVVSSPRWHDTSSIAGAVAWFDGHSGSSGVIDRTNALVASKPGDTIAVKSYALANGNYIISSIIAPNINAVTFGHGHIGLSGQVDSFNSFFSFVKPSSSNTTALVRVFANGDYAIGNPSQANFATNGGAFTLGDGSVGITGTAKKCNTIFGTIENAGLSMNSNFNIPYDYMLVGIPVENSVRILKASYEALAINHDTATHVLSASSNSPTPFIYSGACRLITSIKPNGDAPLAGATTTVALVHDFAPSFFNIPYVRRHVDIQSANASDKSTLRITFYFEQSDFTDYNNSIKGAATQLPSSPSDSRGKANLKIIQAYGTSPTGLLGSYTTTNPQRFNIIDPEDADIIWNPRSLRWEVTVNAIGLGGFFAYGESSPASILNMASKATIDVSPIPATTELNIQVRKEQLCGQMATITDIQGRQVLQFLLKANMRVDVRELATGVYFLRLPDATVVKIAKQ